MLGQFGYDIGDQGPRPGPLSELLEAVIINIEYAHRRVLVNARLESVVGIKDPMPNLLKPLGVGDTQDRGKQKKNGRQGDMEPLLKLQFGHALLSIFLNSLKSAEAGLREEMLPYPSGVPPGFMLLPALIFMASALYSSVGHGGASAYLAVMAILGYPRSFAAPSALTLNILVSGLAFHAFAGAGHFRLRLVAPFLMTSIPCAYFGSTLPVSARTYTLILGASLTFAAVRMLCEGEEKITENTRQSSIPLSLLAGAALGLISGMIGIGGGIFLSPILLLTRWADVKETAAASSLFILLNSMAGLSGHLSRSPGIFTSYWFLLAACGLTGGLLGSRLGAKVLSNKTLRRTLGAVLLAAAAKLLLA